MRVKVRRLLEGVDFVLHHVGPRTHTHTVRLGSLSLLTILQSHAGILSMRWAAFMEVSEGKLHSTVWVTGEHLDELKSLTSSPKGSSHRNLQNTVRSFLLEMVSNCIPVLIILQLSLLNLIKVSCLGK